MKMQKHCYLCMPGLTGFCKFPQAIVVFHTGGSWWGLTGALWFLWLLHFIPEAKGSAETNLPASQNSQYFLE